MPMYLDSKVYAEGNNYVISTGDSPVCIANI